jgi:aerobic carbon-monoxide dehydrogenase medium subunit
VYPFDYRNPATLGEALDTLADVGEDATVLAGGQSLMILLRQQLVRPDVLVGLRGIPALAGVEVRNGRTVLGAMTPYATVAAHPAVRARAPLMSRAAASVGSVHIRNRGTVGGSVCHADPAGDVATVLLAYQASLVVTGPGGRQEHRAEDFFTGLFETRLEPGQLLTAIEIGPQPDTATFGYQRFSFRAGEYPMCVAAVRLEREDGRCIAATVGLGGAGDRPMRLPEAEQRLVGADLADFDARRLLLGIRDLVNPPPDVRGTSAWKARVVEKVVIEAVAESAGQALTAGRARPRRLADG